MVRRSPILPEREPDEAADLDVLADRRDLLGHELVDGPLLVTERLLEEHDVLEPLLELALDDLLADLGGLRRDGLIGGQLGPLGRELFRRDRIHAHPARREARDLDREVPDKLLELLRPGDEVRLAIDLDEHADAAAGVDVAGDEAFAGLSTGLLGRCGETPLAQQRDRLVDVAAGLLEGTLAVHHAGAGALAKVPDRVRGDRGHVVLVLLFVFGGPARARGWWLSMLGLARADVARCAGDQAGVASLDSASAASRASSAAMSSGLAPSSAGAGATAGPPGSRSSSSSGAKLRAAPPARAATSSSVASTSS